MRALLIFVVLAAVLPGQNRNQLTPKEAAEGWLLLYDGESAFGWTPEGSAEWSTGPDGDLTAKSGDSGDMVLNTVFGDYQLYCDVKTPSGKGSGLVLNGMALPAAKAGDKWHTYSVTLSGGHMSASIDGKKAIERDVNAPGSIVLHYRTGDPISIRQCKLHPSGGAAIFNGKDLTGWRAVPGAQAKAPAEWVVRDGMIHVEHGPGQLETEAQYKDFVLSLEVRANSKDPRVHPNSGVFLRGDARGFGTGYQSQIHNGFRDEDRAQPADFGTGAIYRYQAARRVISNDNEFFTKTIIVRGRHFSIFVNGIQVTDWDDPHPEGSAVGKEEAKLTTGNISLQAQDPGANLDFKNLRIAELK